MPTFVATHELHAELLVRHQRTVSALIADWEDLTVGRQMLDGTKAAAEVDLRGVTEMLARKDQHGMGVEGALNVGPLRISEVGEVDTSDDGAERSSSRSNRKCHKSPSYVYGATLIL